VARRKIREQKSKFAGTKNILQQINQPSHKAIHELDPVAPTIPRGGSQNYVLAKSSNDDYDVEWVLISSILFSIDGGNASSTAGSFSFDGGSASAIHSPPALESGAANAAHTESYDGGDS
jgi:hypothetical protein